MSYSPRAHDVTRILARMRLGHAEAASELYEVAYEELRTLAALKLAREPSGITLQATALVHEAWLRLGGDQSPAWDSRAHFFAAAAEAMRRILVDQARRRNALRRGAGAEAVPISQIEVPADAVSDDLLRIHEVLDALATVHPEKAELVKLRYFMGLSLPECAEVRGISLASAKRQWTFARAWLLARMQDP